MICPSTQRSRLWHSSTRHKPETPSRHSGMVDGSGKNTSDVKSVLYVPYATGGFSLAARAPPLPCTLPGVLCPSSDNNVLLFVTTELLTWPLCLTMGSVLTNHLCGRPWFVVITGILLPIWKRACTIKADPSLTACFLCWQRFSAGVTVSVTSYYIDWKWGADSL